MDELTQNLLKNGVFSPFEEAIIRNLAQINENLEKINKNLTSAIDRATERGKL